VRELTQPVLTVDELVIRPWTLSDSDVGAVVAAYQDPAIQRWHVRTMNDLQARDWISSWSPQWDADSGADWAVTDGDQLVGRVGFRRVDLAESCAAISYWTVPAARGRGVAVRAATAASEWMFDRVGLHRIELRHSVLNEASCRVAAKAGFAAEGVLRSSGLHADGWHDMHAHARIAGEE
jgi:RimJ/RimL family protein N-acetyltransferase